MTLKLGRVWPMKRWKSSLWTHQRFRTPDKLEITDYFSNAPRNISPEGMFGLNSTDGDSVEKYYCTEELADGKEKISGGLGTISRILTAGWLSKRSADGESKKQGGGERGRETRGTCFIIQRCTRLIRNALPTKGVKRKRKETSEREEGTVEDSRRYGRSLARGWLRRGPRTSSTSENGREEYHLANW